MESLIRRNIIRRRFFYSYSQNFCAAEISSYTVASIPCQAKWPVYRGGRTSESRNSESLLYIHVQYHIRMLLATAWILIISPVVSLHAKIGALTTGPIERPTAARACPIPFTIPLVEGCMGTGENNNESHNYCGQLELNFLTSIHLYATGAGRNNYYCMGIWIHMHAVTCVQLTREELLMRIIVAVIPVILQEGE